MAPRANLQAQRTRHGAQPHTPSTIDSQILNILAQVLYILHTLAADAASHENPAPTTQHLDDAVASPRPPKLPNTPALTCKTCPWSLRAHQQYEHPSKPKPAYPLAHLAHTQTTHQLSALVGWPLDTTKVVVRTTWPLQGCDCSYPHPSRAHVPPAPTNPRAGCVCGPRGGKLLCPIAYASCP